MNITKDIVKLFPLKEEPLEKINVDTDCIQFLEFFNDIGFNNETDLLEYIKSDDLVNSYEDSKSANNDVTIVYLVTTLKYQFICKRLLQYCCGDDSAFAFHLPFLAEAIYDLECSYYLMKGNYFKQSLQTLRSILEVTLLHAYFALKYLDRDALEVAVKQKYPSLKEMIGFLKTENLVTKQLETEYLRLYKELNSAVHSKIDKLTTYNNFSYKNNFSEWYNTFTSVAKVNILTTLRMLQVGL